MRLRLKDILNRTRTVQSVQRRFAHRKCDNEGFPLHMPRFIMHIKPHSKTKQKMFIGFECECECDSARECIHNIFVAITVSSGTVLLIKDCVRLMCHLIITCGW